MVKLNGKEKEMMHNVKRRNVCAWVCERGGGENEVQSKSCASNDININIYVRE